ncbi:MAG: BF3164 family lipoprotein [Bacteroidales bacterium]|nr:BF3164 family lipoprotein [Bacteroidales bacterium]
MNNSLSYAVCIYLVLPIVALLTFISCSDNAASEDLYHAPIFSDSTQITLLPINEDFKFSGCSLQCIDTLIIVNNMADLSGNVFHLFSANSGKHLKSFGTLGREPGKVTFQKTLFSIDNHQKCIYAYDSSQDKLVVFSLNSVLSGKDDILDMALPENSYKIRMERFYSLNDGLFLWESTDNRFIMSYIIGTIAEYNDFPKLEEPEEMRKVERAYYSYMGTLGISDDRMKFASATSSGCILETFACAGDSIVPIAINRMFKPVYNCLDNTADFPYIVQSNGAVSGICALSCTDNYIYADYSDVPNKTTNKVFAVFDWDCRPVRLINFNDKIISMDVLEGDSFGCALAEREDGTIYLARFEL